LTEGLATQPFKYSVKTATEPEVFYMNRETGQCQWQKPDGKFQYAFAEIQNTFAKIFLIAPVNMGVIYQAHILVGTSIPRSTINSDIFLNKLFFQNHMLNN